LVINLVINPVVSRTGTLLCLCSLAVKTLRTAF